MKSWKGMKTKLSIKGNGVDKDKYLDLSTNANNWRKISLSLLLIIVLLTIAIIKISVANKVETFVLEKKGNNYEVVGNVSQISKTQNKASDAEIIYFLNEVLYNTKTLPQSEEIYLQNYKKSLYYLSKNASKKFDKYLKDEGYVEKKKNGDTIEIVYNTGQKISDNVYQIRWQQITYARTGEVISQDNYQGLLTVEFKEIKNIELLYKNPLGLIITDFSQKKELI